MMATHRVSARNLAVIVHALREPSRNLLLCLAGMTIQHTPDITLMRALDGHVLANGSRFSLDQWLLEFAALNFPAGSPYKARSLAAQHVVMSRAANVARLFDDTNHAHGSSSANDAADVSGAVLFPGEFDYWFDDGIFATITSPAAAARTGIEESQACGECL